jgi:dolichol-phosphate mannosyltransferase
MKQLSIILPVYNEKDTIETVLGEWKSVLDKQKITYSFVICEDGSSDGTADLLKEISKKYPLILNQKKQRRGYGKAIIDGIRNADSKFIFCVDSDGQYDPKDFSKFWETRNQSGVLAGWRVNRADNSQRKIFSRMFKVVFKLMFRTKLHDPSSTYVLFKKTTIYPFLNYLTFLDEGFWWGFMGMCVKKNILVKELPISHRKRIKGETKVFNLKEIPEAAFRNFVGLVKLRVSH